MEDPRALSRLSRRRLLLGGVAAVGLPAVTAGAAMPAAAAAGEVPVSMAMHLHASYSEGTGSMHSHLEQARRVGVDVVWWTDHDMRAVAHLHREAVHFDGPTETENGQWWTWTRQTAGSPTTATSTWVTSPTSPGDTGTGALRLVAAGAGTAFSTLTMVGSARNSLFRTGLTGQTLTLDVLGTSLSANAYVELAVGLSHHPATGGRPAGRYRIAYRVGGGGVPGSAVATGISGVVTLPAAAQGWTTIRTDLVADVARLWPDLVAGDNSTYAVDVVVGARRGARADVVVDNLRFVRAGRTGSQVVATQRALADAHAAAYPTVTQHVGSELSLYREHLGYYGADVVLPDLTGVPAKGLRTEAALRGAIDHVHATGSLVSYNHPFGSGNGAALTAAQQTAVRRETAAGLVEERLYGADLLEVGYVLRNGVDLDNHVALWDALSRNAVFLTGTGVSDDHAGTRWLAQKLNHLTWVWAPDRTVTSLVSALAAGRAWFGDPAQFRGELDLLVDGTVPMGAVTAGTTPTRSVRVLATNLPAGSRLQLVRGVVDLAGPGAPDPVTSVVLDVPAPAAGFAEVAVDTATACFVRPVVRTAAGVAVAFGNPVWLLRSLPAGTPAARRV